MNRKSVIRTVVEEHGEVFVVDLYENGRLIQTREIAGHNRYYAEDLAENWETGIIQFLNEEG
jgi:hypothetical protein